MTPQMYAPRNFFDSLFSLKEAGIPVGSVIDIGCADGNFSLLCWDLFDGEIELFNIDAQEIYEDSLRKIQETVGGYYRIGGISSFNGQLNFAISSHPYWSKAEQVAERISDASSSTDTNSHRIDVRTIDSLLAEVELPKPHLIKMDIEGAEFSALQGAVNSLDDVSILILETDIFYGLKSSGNFLEVCNFLTARNFSLFDIVNLGYRPTDNILYQVYLVFLNKKYEFRHTRSFAADPAKVEELMNQRREAILSTNAKILADINDFKSALSGFRQQ